ncbi:MAG: RnfABCDGE type electron transport complex subunit D [Candidatus Doudnabacteria bacterium]|nr:RnfABCDGE type electron transport complex subunit D [Candidatus Doudnabacteria bacterium]
MFKYIDHVLDRVTMYRLVLYFLVFIYCLSVVLALFGLLHIDAFGLLYSLAVLLVASFITNRISAKFFRVSENFESVYITALILSLVLVPPVSGQYLSVLWVLLGAAGFAQISKYAINYKGKHIFNPAAFGIFAVALFVAQPAVWWVGSTPLFLPLLVGCFLILRKLKKFLLAAGFLGATFGITWFVSGASVFLVTRQLFLSSSFLFFLGVMLTEPVTTPPTKIKQILYGMVTGVFFSPVVHVGNLYFTPEIALLLGNIFSFLVSPKFRYSLRLNSIEDLAKGIKQFSFSGRAFKFLPGQYMEWTLRVKRFDSRGNRRFLTIASSPTEQKTLIGVRFYENPSAFKSSLLSLLPGASVLAGQLAGEFVLPENKNIKLAFLAGGIGVTPFRSMLKYLVDKNERRNIVMLYGTGSEEEIAYREIWDEAGRKLGITIWYSLANPSKSWSGLSGYISRENILKAVPDYKDRVFYISGSQRMVEGAKEALFEMGVKRSKIKTDFFPGLA